MARAPVLAVPPGLVSCRAALAYDDDARRVLTSLKNGDQRSLVTELADLITPLAPAGPLLVTWAPTGPQRRRTRGFDQAELLARAVARRLGQPCRGLLRRDPGPPQSGRTAADRRTNPAFHARAACGGAVLLVDDVATTGATLASAARALRAAGAMEVHGLVVARAG